MGKKVMIAVGSPRKKGNSATLAKQVADGAKAGGARVETFFLHHMNIKPCTACDACRKKKDVDCIIQDDMQMLYPKLRDADAIVIASPDLLVHCFRSDESVHGSLVWPWG